jgi:hypothetical protein
MYRVERPKGVRGSPCEASKLPDHQAGERDAIILSKLRWQPDAEAITRSQRRNKRDLNIDGRCRDRVRFFSSNWRGCNVRRIAVPACSTDGTAQAK